jgi:integrase/recombinase XerD
LVGFLAGYSGQTRAAYTLDLRQYTSWCATHGLHLFAAKRTDIECYARDLESSWAWLEMRCVRIGTALS